MDNIKIWQQNMMVEWEIKIEEHILVLSIMAFCY